ncbi:hypothetical protein GCM10010112_06880 [Actinoplanes lobatus]|uniref:Uncharacterized protein n=1 Tax=Actinoplanes lobatus TaxID=113568 RepID=A0ABQ4AEA4_9ACTN|nr:hypothetical protein GCM10010112_06880 [Actinoplanes lobatus]GIE39324.1 hypothetical protein Alo02nite_22220 [Actinoplanes lobatus]
MAAPSPDQALDVEPQTPREKTPGCIRYPKIFQRKWVMGESTAGQRSGIKIDPMVTIAGESG